MSKNYTHTIAALKSNEAGDWDLADALLADIPVGTSHKAFTDITKMAVTEGIRVPSVSKLRQDRSTADFWPSDKRITDTVGRGISFTAHREARRAGDLAKATDLLDGLLRKVGGNAHKVTVPMVKAALNPGAVIAATTKANVEAAAAAPKVAPMQVVQCTHQWEQVESVLGQAIKLLRSTKTGLRTKSAAEYGSVSSLVRTLTDLVAKEEAKRVRPAPTKVGRKPAAVKVAPVTAEVVDLFNQAEDTKAEATIAKATAKRAPSTRGV